MKRKTREIILAVTAAIFAVTPWEMTKVDCLIWFVLVYAFLCETVKLVQIEHRKAEKLRARARSKRDQYELVGYEADGSVYMVSGSRQ